MAERPAEVLTDRLSESADGRPIFISATSQTAADPIHNVTPNDAIDCVWVDVHNNTDATVVVTFNVSPADITNAAACDVSEMIFSVPAYATVPVLNGQRMRASGEDYVVGAYVGSGDSDKLVVTGHVVRRFQTDISPF